MIIVEKHHQTQPNASQSNISESNISENISTKRHNNAATYRQPQSAGTAPSRPVKRSFTIAGHRTSISLENAFWQALRDISLIERCSLASIVSNVDRDRGTAGLSGAVRVWVLDYFRNNAIPASSTSTPDASRMPNS